LNFLIVEDDEFKEKILCDFLEGVLGPIAIQSCKSLVEAIDSVNRDVFDLIFLDMAIPSHPIVSGGGAPMSFLTGGIEVLLELNALNRKDPCLIVTQYPEIEISGEFYPVSESAAAIKEKLDCEVIACVEFAEGSSSWEKEIKRVLIDNEYINS
jgi:CheY-like chemotaxis protein